MRELGTYAAHLSKVALNLDVLPGSDVVHLAGQLDLNTHAYVRDRVLHGLEFTQSKLVLELSGLDLLDSSGIGALVQLNRGLEQRDVLLVLVTDSAHQRKLFKISALDQVIPISESLAEATEDDDPDGSEPATAS